MGGEVFELVACGEDPSKVRVSVATTRGLELILEDSTVTDL